MYMVLYPSTPGSGNTEELYNVLYTTDTHNVSKALTKVGVRVFRIDDLTEIKEIEISYKEVT